MHLKKNRFLFVFAVNYSYLKENLNWQKSVSAVKITSHYIASPIALLYFNVKSYFCYKKNVIKPVIVWQYWQRGPTTHQHSHDQLDWFQMSGGACPDEWLWHGQSFTEKETHRPSGLTGRSESRHNCTKAQKQLLTHTHTQTGAWSASSVRVGWQTLRYAKWMLIMERHRGQTFIISKLITAIFLYLWPKWTPYLRL